jgi:hypothetical protein
VGTLTFNSFVLSGSDPDICIDLIEGYLQVPNLRGKDWIVPRLDGQVAGNRRLDKLIVPAAGFVKGSGGTPDARREDFNVNVTALLAALDVAGDPHTLELAAGYLGLPSGSEAVAEARVRNASPGRVLNGQSFQLWTFDFEIYAGAWDVGS